MKKIYAQFIAILLLTPLFSTGQMALVQIGTGASVNSSFSYPAPYGNYYWGAKHQFLIRASELTILGAAAGNIDRLDFYVQTAEPTPLASFTIKMGHTTLSVLTSTPISGLTSVYINPAYAPLAGWNTHLFPLPFVWNGTDNIVIETCFNNPTPTNNCQMQYTTTSFASASYYRANNTNVCSQASGFTTSSNRPNMRLNVTLCATAPTANFSSNVQSTCPGGSINFFDQSGCLPTSWSWSFPGGTPSTSTAQNPTVTYPSAGTYNVTLTATNGNGSNTLTLNNYITVSATCPVIIGNGTNSNPNTGYPAPYGNWYWGAKHQMLIRASEIIAAGGTAGNITSLAFDVAAAQGTPLQGFSIKMGATSLTSLTTSFVGTLTTVYGPVTYTETAGLNTHTFSTPFYWNGTSNIIVETCFNNGSYTYNAQTYYTATSFTSVAYRNQDASGVCGQTTAFSTSMNRPNMRLMITGCSGPPTANLTSNVTTACVGGSPIQFQDMSVNCPSGWLWSFPGGTPSSSTAQNPTVTYSTPGTYSVSLTATNGNGSNTITMPNYITVAATCPIIVGTGTSTNTATGYPAPYGNYYWGAKHQMLIRASEFTAAGGFAGLITGLGFDVAVPQGVPLTGFSIYLRTTTATTLTTTFVTGMNQVYGPITYTESSGWNMHTFSSPFYWNGTDNIVIETCFNNSSYTSNAQHRYTNVGYTAVAVRYQDVPNVCMNTLGSLTSANRPNMQFTITPCSSAPVANFYAVNTTACVGGSPVSFIDNSLCATSWSWSFPGGTPATSTAQNPTITYSTAGTYSATLTVTNGFGNNSITLTNYITVNPYCPIIIGTGTATNTSSGYAAPYGNYYWGARHQILIRASEITAAGGAAGLIKGIGFQVAVQQGTPLQDFTVRFGTTPSTTLTSTFITGLPIRYGPTTFTEGTGWNMHTFTAPFYWNGTDNVVIETCFQNNSYTGNAQHYYTNAGFSSVNFYRADNLTVCGNTTGTVSVNRPNVMIDLEPCTGAPIVLFTSNATTTCVGSTVNFTDQSGCTPLSWQWTFPGGTPSSSSLQNPTVVYSTPGVYSVTLKATNLSGSDSLTQYNYITVSGKPVVNFSASATQTNVGIPINFTDLSQCSPTSWSWSFPGASPSTSTAQNPSGITYGVTGNYTVTLIACNSWGCDTLTRVAYITVSDLLISNCTYSPSQLATSLVGPGISISNVTSNCAPNAMCHFTGSGTGINSGLIMTSGSVTNAPGPNNTGSAGVNNGFPGDTTLDAFAGFPTFNACVLEFDVIPVCDSLTLTYSFASEEYPEYSYSTSQYNDVFAFFIQGLSVPLPTNFAWVPGTLGTPITVKTVSPDSNSVYFTLNTNQSVQYDGYTVIIRSGFPVVPLTSYHIKLAIADASDGIFDSGILILDGSLQSLNGNSNCFFVSLPVELLSFTAKPQGAYNVLEWTTASEVNNDFFIVEHSSDGINFEAIQKEEGNGTTNSVHHYNATDKKPFYGTSYYRLRQYDMDGTYHFSNVIAVNNFDAVWAFVLYPNPAADDIHMNIESPVDATIQLEVYNAVGNQVLTFAESCRKGPNTLKFRIDGLAPGVYTLKAKTSDSEVDSRQVVTPTLFVKY